jgi:hypothetical protein
VDGESIAEFESDLKGNVYKLWNRLSSGSHFPPPERTVEIPKDTGGKRPLGISTVSDRIAQMVVKIYLEPEVEPHFHQDSVDHIGRILHGLGWTPQKPKRRSIQRNEIRIKEWIKVDWPRIKKNCQTEGTYRLYRRKWHADGAVGQENLGSAQTLSCIREPASRKKISVIVALGITPRKHELSLYFRLHPDANIDSAAVVAFLRCLLKELSMG